MGQRGTYIASYTIKQRKAPLLRRRTRTSQNPKTRLLRSRKTTSHKFGNDLLRGRQPRLLRRGRPTSQKSDQCLRRPGVVPASSKGQGAAGAWARFRGATQGLKVVVWEQCTQRASHTITTQEQAQAYALEFPSSLFGNTNAFLQVGTLIA